MSRLAHLSLILSVTALCSACVVLPPNARMSTDSAELAKMSEQALATCGAGNVKEVSTKSFSCK